MAGPPGVGRRVFLESVLAASAGAVVPRAVGASAPSADGAPPIPACAASGDVSRDRAVVWARATEASRVVIEYSSRPSFAHAAHVVAPLASAATDFTTRVSLAGLPAGQRIAYRVRFEPLDRGRPAPDPVLGSFRTPPAGRGGVSFVWGGDVAGQGWGIDAARGGFRTFDAMRRASPDLFIHSGDSIYADNPILPEVALGDGTVWRNLVTPEKTHVAETLADFRGNHRYNLLDGPLRAFQAEVPWVMQWDDHEVLNNWYPGETHGDARYAEKDASLLAGRAKRAFLEYAPIHGDPGRGGIHRALRYGPSMDVFVLDLRALRGPNSANRQAVLTPAARILGAAQLRWLEDGLASSRATWKVIASDLPLGLAIPDGEHFEAVANGDPGPPLGREHEIAHLLAHIARRRVRNVVWLTADVHYAAAHHYHPERAAFRGFDPFWEFVAGPLHAGTFLPTPLDATFGPEVKYVSVPPGMKPNRPPSEGLQFFGRGAIAAGSEALTVSLHDRDGRRLYSVDLTPER
jgi:alkaline phosphatase D